MILIFTKFYTSVLDKSGQHIKIQLLWYSPFLFCSTRAWRIINTEPKFFDQISNYRKRSAYYISMCKKIRRIFWAAYFLRKSYRLIDNREKLVKNTVLSITHVTSWPLIEFFMLKWTLTVRTTYDWNISQRLLAARFL